GGGGQGLCHVKAALKNRAGDALADLTEGSERLDSLEGMYEAELQELNSAEGQLGQLANDLSRTMTHPELAFRLQEYATELQARRRDLENFLARIGADVRGEMDDAMRALIAETEKMW